MCSTSVLGGLSREHTGDCSILRDIEFFFNRLHWWCNGNWQFVSLPLDDSDLCVTVFHLELPRCMNEVIYIV